MSLPVSIDVSAVPAKPAGAGRYVVELVRHLALGGEVDLSLVARQGDGDRWREWAPDAEVSAIVPSPRPLRLAWEQLRLPAVVNSGDSAVHHGPHYTVPERTQRPVVATVHDMTFFDHPEWHERSKVWLFKRAITRAVQRAEGIVAVSNDTARRLTERFPEARVTVIAHGVDHDRFTSAADPRVDDALLASVGIGGRFVAYVGTLEPRKNVPALLQAFDRLAADDSDLKLVLAGRPGWKLEGFEAALASTRHADRVVRTGFLPDGAVPALLRRAEAVAYPSLTEGFGLPALEALACGAALVTTTGSAMEEVVDDAAVLVEPNDVEGLTAELRRLLDGGPDVDVLRRRGPEVAARFTWQASAAAHAELYRSIAGDR